MDINFHRLNSTQGSSYLPLSKWSRNKRVIANPKNENDEECLKCAVIAGLHNGDIKSHPE